MINYKEIFWKSLFLGWLFATALFMMLATMSCSTNRNVVVERSKIIMLTKK